MASGAELTGRRVAILTPCFWPEVQRGSERILRDLALDLADAGHRPRIITSHPGAPRKSIEDGIPVVRHWRPPERLLIRRAMQEYVTHLPFTYASLALGGDDVAHSFYATDAAAARRFGDRSGLPTVFTYGGIPRRDVIAAKRLRVRVLSEAMRSDAVVAYSRAAAAGIKRWFGVEAQVVYPGVRLEDWQVTSERAPEPTIACAGAVDDARKRIPLLMAAFRRVLSQRPGARLVLQRPPEAAARRELEATPGVELFAPGPNAVGPVFRNAWVSVLASYNEAFGLVLVESLACGTPVVGTRDGGIPEIVDRPEVGQLFEGGEGELARALLETLELAADARTQANCRARAADFTTVRAARDYEAIYAAAAGPIE